MDLYSRLAGRQQYRSPARRTVAAEEHCRGAGRPLADHEDYILPLLERHTPHTLAGRHTAAL